MSDSKTIHANRALIIWLYSGCFLVFAMVVVGGITRLTGSGLSITEWNIVTGTIPPLNEQSWQVEFDKYKLSPQYEMLNSNFSLSDFKSIYWWEFIHRLLGRLTGLIFIIPFLIFLYRKQISKSLLPKLIFIFLLGAWQGFLGWYMVKSGLLNGPFVSHYRLALHLVNAFITFGYIFWVVQDLRSVHDRRRPLTLWNFLSVVLLLLALVQIVFGAFVAGLHAGLVYNTWPKMGDEWIAESVGYALMKDGWSSWFNNLASVQFVHRMLAIVLIVSISVMWFVRNCAQLNLTSSQKEALNWCMFFTCLQFLLGVTTLLYRVPLWMGVAHQVGAFLVFGALVFNLSVQRRT